MVAMDPAFQYAPALVNEPSMAAVVIVPASFNKPLKSPATAKVAVAKIDQCETFPAKSPPKFIVALRLAPVPPPINCSSSTVVVSNAFVTVRLLPPVPMFTFNAARPEVGNACHAHARQSRRR